MTATRVASIAVVCLLAASPPAAAQAQSDSDPTRPVLFSIRPEFYRVTDGVWAAQVIARYDQATLRNRRWLGGKRGLLLRMELPIVTRDAPGLATAAGLGDAYVQFLSIPRMSRRFGLVAGSGLVMPTATNTRLGGGKWILAPAVLPVWFIPGTGLVFVKLQDFVSVAGDDGRPDVHFLLVTPTLIRSLGRRSWMLLDTETRTDWRRHGETGVKSGVQFGRKLAGGAGLWIKPEVWWGPNRGGDWNLKTGIVWYR